MKGETGSSPFVFLWRQTNVEITTEERKVTVVIRMTEEERKHLEFELGEMGFS